MTFKLYAILVALDILLFLGYGLAVFLRAVRRIFSRRTKS